MKQLGHILLEGGHLTQEQLASAVDEQRRLGRSLGRVLVDMGILSEGQLVRREVPALEQDVSELLHAWVSWRRGSCRPHRTELPGA